MNIKELLQQPEGKTVEFKRDLSSLQPILKTIIAFVNTAGGTLIIGKEDDGNINGITDLQKQQDKLANAIAENISPMLFPEFEFFTVDQKHLLIVQVHHIPAPFFLKSEGDIDGVYLRLGATTRKSPPEFIAEIKRRRANQYFDEEPCLQAEQSDLDMQLIEQFFYDTTYKITDEKMTTLKILCKSNGKILLTNGGILLFGKEDKRLALFPNAEISCARFAGNNKSDFIDRLDITDSFLFAVDEVAKFIRRNTQMAAEFGDIKRKDIPEYPVKAIREVLINAFIHANYELRSSRFYLAIYSDRLEIQNPGNWPPGITFDDFKSGISKLRNPMVARIFREKEKLEAWGSGFQRIANICEQQNYPIPVWAEIGPILRVTFYPRLYGVSDKQGRDQSGIKLASSWHQAGIKLASSSIEYKILVFCKKPQKLSDIQAHVNLKDRVKFKRKYIDGLLEQKMLKMTHPDKPKSPDQHYLTTEAGHQLL